MKYLIQFAQQHPNFRLPELECISKIFDFEFRIDSEYCLLNPFLVIETEPEHIQKILQRSILIRNVFKLLSTGTDLESLLESTKSVDVSEYRKKSFKFDFDSFNSRLDSDFQRRTIDRFSFMNLEGEVEMKTPEVVFSVLFDFGVKQMRDPPLERVFFGVKIANESRSLVDKFNLKKRKYVGTTSMDAELSLIMSNFALVRNGKSVYDPFIGTGSILYAAAHFGGYCFGSDIDGRQIRGKGGKSVQSNIDQYHLTKILDTLIFDITTCPIRFTGWLDAIVTDPPYGVRAGARKIGTTEQPREASPIEKTALYPKTVVYETEEVFLDLLEFASKNLRIGGRLCYWLPIIPEEYEPNEIPSHPSLSLVFDCEQPFNGWSRRLITMEKTKEIDASPVSIPALKGSFREKYFQPK